MGENSVNVDSSKSSRGDTHVKLVSKTSSDAVRQEDASAKVAAALDAKLREIQSERSSLVELPLLSATNGDEEDVKVSLSNDTSSSTKEVETTLPSKDDVESSVLSASLGELETLINDHTKLIREEKVIEEKIEEEEQMKIKDSDAE